MSKALCFALSVFVWVALAAWSIDRFSPAFPRVLRLDVELGRTDDKLREPLIATGRSGAGDLLYVRYDAGLLYIECDNWGHPPGAPSRPWPIPTDRRLSLVVEMPALYAPHGVYGVSEPRLRVSTGNVTLLEEKVAQYQHAATEVWFGENAIHATTAEARFSGTIRDEQGRLLWGSPRDYLSTADRTTAWLRHRWDQIIAITALAFLTYAGSRRQRAVRHRLACLFHAHRLATILIVGTIVAFSLLVRLGLVSWTEPDMFNRFFDYQTIALREGRLDVPWDAIQGENFQFGGKYYGYFGLTPSLLRLPVSVFDPPIGSLAAPLLILEFGAALFGAYFLLCQTAELFRPEHALRRLTIVTYLLACGAGSALFYLCVRPVFFHEAVLSGAMAAIWSSGFTVRFIRTRELRWWWWAIFFGALAANGRPTTGMYALMFAAGAKWMVPSDFVRRAVAGGIAFLALFSANAVSYLKFHTFDGAPLQYAPSYPPERRQVIDGRKFHVENIPFGLYSYIVRPNFHLTREPLFMRMGSRTPATVFPRAKIDVVDEVLGPPYSMPCLFFFGIVGSLFCFALKPNSRRLLFLVWAAAAPVFILLLAFISVAMRYLGDMCPALYALSAIVLIELDLAASVLALWLRRIAGVCAAVAVPITLALVVDYQSRWGQHMPGPVKARYQRLWPGIGRE